MARVTLSISDEERQALVNLARAELRDPRAQGALILRQALKAAGYLPQTQHNQVTTGSPARSTAG